MAFANCYALTSAWIAPSVTSMGDYVFGGANNADITGYAGSYAETYASEYSIDFIAITECAEHTFGDWVVTKKATVASEGEKYRDCTLCFASETETISKLDPETLPAGDTDGDGEVSVSDVMNIFEAVLNGTSLNKADMNGDGKLTLVDVLRAFKSIAA